MGQIVLLEPPALFYGLWYSVQPVLDPVTKSKVVMLRGQRALQVYSDVEWRGMSQGERPRGGEGSAPAEIIDASAPPDPNMAAWIETVAGLPGVPGSFPVPYDAGEAGRGGAGGGGGGDVGLLRDPATVAALRCAASCPSG